MRRRIARPAAIGLIAVLLAGGYLALGHGSQSTDISTTTGSTPAAPGDLAERGDIPNPPVVIYPDEWMAGNCKVWGGGAVEITSVQAAAKGGRVFEKGLETFYSLANGNCVSLIGPPPHPDWVPEWAEKLPTPRPRNGAVIRIDPSDLPPGLETVSP